MKTKISSPKKEKLELREKKVDIQKKKVELQKEKLNINDLLDRKQIALEEHKMQLEKVTELRMILSEITIDPERTLLGSEPFLMPLLNDSERDIVMNKMMSIIKKF